VALSLLLLFVGVMATLSFLLEVGVALLQWLLLSFVEVMARLPESQLNGAVTALTGPMLCTQISLYESYNAKLRAREGVT
jgi:hypothetical protein